MMFLTFAIYSSELVTDANIEYITVGFRACPFWDEQDSLYFELFFQAPSKLKQIYLHLFHLFFFFEILQTIGLFVFNKRETLEWEWEAQMSSPHGLQHIFGFSFTKLDIGAYGIFIVIL